MGRLTLYPQWMLFVVLSFVSNATAQVPRSTISSSTLAFPKEITDVIINSELLLAGEQLRYKIYNLSDENRISTLSKIAYVSLRNEEDSVIFSHKLRLRQGTAHGSFFIPSSLQGGIYKLISYTWFSLNNEIDAIGQQNIYIINPYQAYAVNSLAQSSVCTVRPNSSLDMSLTLQPRSHQSGISLTSDRPVYKRRSRVSLTIWEMLDESALGNYTLSVRKVDSVEIIGSETPWIIDKMSHKDTYFVPELRGELISGTVVTSDLKKPAADKVVAFSLPGNNYIYKLAKTNDEGRFYFSINEEYISTRCIIQVIEDDRAKYDVSLDSKEVSGRVNPKERGLMLEVGIRNWLQGRSIQNQIENAYYDDNRVKIDSVNFPNPFYGNLGVEFSLDDYTRFPTVKETFVEVIRLARIRKRGNKEVFEVFDPINPYKTGPFSDREPLVLVDGISILAAEQVLNMSAFDLESVHVFPEPYRYGPSIFRGIIDIKTKNRRFNLPLQGEYQRSVELKGTLAASRYLAPDYSIEHLERIPDYRVQLLWEPNLRIDSVDPHVSFFTSDVSGLFKITLEGYSDEGKYLLLNSYFEVE